MAGCCVENTDSYDMYVVLYFDTVNVTIHQYQKKYVTLWLNARLNNEGLYNGLNNRYSGMHSGLSNRLTSSGLIILCILTISSILWLCWILILCSSLRSTILIILT